MEKGKDLTAEEAQRALEKDAERRAQECREAIKQILTEKNCHQFVVTIQKPGQIPYYQILIGANLKRLREE